MKNSVEIETQRLWKTLSGGGREEQTRCIKDEAQMANSQFFNITKFA